MKFSKVIKVIGTVLLFLLLFVSFFVGFALHFMMSNWSNLSLYELIMQLKTLSGTTAESVFTFLLDVVLPSFLLTLLVLVLYLVSFRFRKKSEKERRIFRCLLLCVSLISSFCFSVPESVLAYDYLGVRDYIQNSNKKSDFIDTYYVSPNDVALEFPEQKRNLICLYMESMEMTYSDTAHGGYFQDDYIKELTDLGLENECFSDGMTLNGSTSLEYTNWTMAGLFSTSTGLPFKTSLGQNNMDTQETFFPHVVALGDILREHGYDQTFLCGSDSSFAGRSLYFKSHGDFSVHDFYTYRNKYGVGVENQWGFMDYHLFDYAKEEIQEKAKNYTDSLVPFNYEFLTVDTHFYIGNNDGHQDGFLCSKCPDDYGDNQYANVIRCSSMQANEFVEWFYGKDGNTDISDLARENTTVVIMGDHPTMSTYFCKKAVQDGFYRRSYVCFINSARKRDSQMMRTYCHFDLFPTILSSLGVTIPGNKLALGVDLYSGEKTYLELFDKDYINMQLQGKSSVIDSLLEVNPYEYNYLKRIGRLPTATSDFTISENGITLNLSTIDKHGLDEELTLPKAVLTCKSGKEEIELEENVFGYSLNLDKEKYTDSSGSVDFDVEFTTTGKKSNNTYSLSKLHVLQK